MYLNQHNYVFDNGVEYSCGQIYILYIWFSIIGTYNGRKHIYACCKCILPTKICHGRCRAKTWTDDISTGTGGIEINSIEAGFNRINPNKFHRFDVDCAGKATVDVSVFYMDKETGKPSWICEALAKDEGSSVLITENGKLVDTNYGTI